MNDMFPTRRDFMNFGGRFFDDWLGQGLSGTKGFDTDIKETDKEYILKADMPGIPKDKIELDYHDNVLSISGSYEHGEEETDEEGNYIRRERTTRSYNRQFLMKDIDGENITAKFENGLLTVNLPKREPKEPTTKKITIE